MNNYQKLQAIAGLINAVDKEIYRKEQFNKLTQDLEVEIVEDYYDSILEVINS